MCGRRWQDIAKKEGTTWNRKELEDNAHAAMDATKLM